MSLGYLYRHRLPSDATRHRLFFDFNFMHMKLLTVACHGQLHHGPDVGHPSPLAGEPPKLGRPRKCLSSSTSLVKLTHVALHLQQSGTHEVGNHLVVWSSCTAGCNRAAKHKLQNLSKSQLCTAECNTAAKHKLQNLSKSQPAPSANQQCNLT